MIPKIYQSLKNDTVRTTDSVLKNTIKGNYIAMNNHVCQTIPAQAGGFSNLFDRIGANSFSVTEFKEKIWVRFSTAPDYILKRIRETPGSWNVDQGEGGSRDGHKEWCGMCCETGESLFTYIHKRRLAEARFMGLITQNPRLNCSAIRTACWGYDLQIQMGNGPTVRNWSYSDDHPGSYSDEAWTSSEEVAPGVYLEKRHACMGRTGAWLIIGPVPENLPIAA